MMLLKAMVEPAAMKERMNVIPKVVMRAFTGTPLVGLT
jgi:hypothetical protein